MNHKSWHATISPTYATRQTYTPTHTFIAKTVQCVIRIILYATNKTKTNIHYKYDKCASQLFMECIDFASGLTRALYFKYLKNVFFFKCVLQVYKIPIKNTIYSSLHKKGKITDLRVWTVCLKSYQILSLLCTLLYNVFQIHFLYACSIHHYL
jgi:hypothetical protein